MPRPNRPPPGFFKESESKHPGRRRADAPSSGGGAGGAPVGLEPGVGRGILPPRNPPMPRRPMGPPPGFSNDPQSRHPRRGTATDAGAPSSGGGAGGAGGARRTGDLVRAFGRCRALLDDLLGDDDGWVFEAPVDARALGLRDYYTVIADPMDLGTVLHRLERRRYAHPSAFAADVRLTFSNAMSYNNPGDPVYESAVELSGIFEDRWASIEAEMPPAPPTDAERRVRINDELTGLPVPGQRAAARVLKERGVCLLEKKGKVEVDLDGADAATLDELGRLVVNYRAADADVGAPCRIHERHQTDGPIPKRKRINERCQTDKPRLKKEK